MKTNFSVKNKNNSKISLKIIIIQLPTIYKKVKI